MKRVGFTVLSTLIVMLVSVPSFAYSEGCWKRESAYRPGPCWSQGTWADDLTEEKRSELRKLEAAFFEETGKLRRDIWAKSDELNAILRASDPDAKRAKSLQKEVSALKTEMAGRRTDFILKAKKIDPDANYGRRGFGRGSGKDMRGCGGPCGWRGHRSYWE